MTDHDWQTSADPRPMLDYLRGQTSPRKLQLFAVACCARVAHLIPDALGRKAIAVAERCADGQAAEKELWAIADAYCPCGVYNADYGHPATRAAHHALYPETADRAAAAAAAACKRTRQAAERAAQADLARCIFGNPFHRSDFPTAWRSSAVVQLADAIYEEPAFERMPILADALEDAGCVAIDILDHCRQSGPHARGCWVIDLVRP